MTVGGPREPRLRVTLALLALVLSCAAGCGGGANEGRPSLTASPSRSITQSLPSLPSATRSVTGRPTATGSGGGSIPTSPTAGEPTTAPPTTAEAPPTTPESTSEPTTSAPEPSKPTTESSGANSRAPEAAGSPSAATSGAATKGDGGSEGDNTAWLVAILVLIATAAATAGLVMLRRRTARREWAAGFGTAQRESERMARDILPALLAESRESRRGGWSVARPDVLALEDQLAGLARSAPDEQQGAHAESLRESLGQVRQALDEEVRAGGGQADVALGAAREAVRQLDARLVLVTPSPGPQ